MSRLFRSSSVSDESEWLSVSDMMAALMVIFLFVAIVLIRPLIEQRAKIERIAIIWFENEARIYEALVAEFEDDLPLWDAEIEKDTLLVRFRAPNVLFEFDSDELQPRFKLILDDFFPRYARVLRPFMEHIEELRIEGHTDTTWKEEQTRHEGYVGNMKLSQARTRSVLDYVLKIDSLYEDKKWVQELLTANGLSFSKPVMVDGIEDKNASRRVEFRVRTEVRREFVRIVKELRNEIQSAP